MFKTFYVIITLVFSVQQGHACKEKWRSCGDDSCCCMGETAECMKRNLTYIPTLPSGIIELPFEGNYIKVLSAETFENLANLTIKTLNLASNGIERISSGTFAPLNSLQKLDMTSNYLINASQLSKSLGSIHKSLSTLILNDCGVNNISDDFFEGLIETNIETMFLQNNHMKLFNEVSFSRLRTLKTLDLSKNWISNFTYTANGTRTGHSTVEYLNLSNNEFNHYTPWFCDRGQPPMPLYPNLKSLNLSVNIIMIPLRNAWSCLKTLKQLDISGNVIKRIANNTFSDLVSLEKLYISDIIHPIQTVQPTAFKNYNLKEFKFRNNRLKFRKHMSFPYKSFLRFTPNLISLDLGYNYFVNFPGLEFVDMLSDLPKLKVLNLDGAHLFHIPDNLLKNFNLTQLHLKDNKISWINPVAFMNVTTLRYLDLGFNKITVINETLPSSLQHSLKVIDLSHNPLSCICHPLSCTCDNTWFKSWLITSKIYFIGWPKYYKCGSPPNKAGTPFIEYKQ